MKQNAANKAGVFELSNGMVNSLGNNTTEGNNLMNKGRITHS